ncbi:hypothetical protein [Pseudomonas phage PA1C]|nr:hypothetical protein [Pseudomonas phage PA1C]BEG72685.1 hypothetical protein RVBP21_3130 [Pseudomonas phage BRkr]
MNVQEMQHVIHGVFNSDGTVDLIGVANRTHYIAPTQIQESAGPRTCGIMINSKVIDRQIVQMTDVVRNKMLQTHVPKNEDDHVAEEDSVIALMQDCVNKHVEYILTAPAKENVGFVHYVEEYFPSIKNDLINDSTTMLYLEAKFAETTGMLGECLQPAIADLENNGCLIDKIENFAVGQYDSYYVLVGDNPDAPYTDDPADGPHVREPYNPNDNPYREQARLEREQELQLAMLPPEDRESYLRTINSPLSVTKEQIGLGLNDDT